jgi:uncharacterized protein YjiS (DUF1127 family)
MPCGSTDCSSTRYIKTIPPSFPEFGWLWQIPLSWLFGMAAWSERRSRYRELRELDDRLLADIGLSRHQVGEDPLRASRTFLTMWHADR